MNSDGQNKAAIEEHWQASESGDSKVEHAIYGHDAILDYPQSGERFRGRARFLANAGPTPPIGTSRCSGSSAATILGE